MGNLRERLHELSARRAGRKDGRRGIPALDADTYPFELLAIKQRGDEAVWRVARAWREHDAGPLGREQALTEEVRRAEAALADLRRRVTEAERVRAAEEKEDRERRRALERNHAVAPENAPTQTEAPPEIRAPAPAEEAPGVPLMQKVETPVAGEAGALETASAHGIPALVYWVVLALIVLCELPLNSLAFRVFGESDLFTYVIAAGVAIVLVLSGHGYGSMLHDRERTIGRAVLAWGLLVVPIIVIAFISIVRTSYLDLDPSSRILIDHLGPVVGTLSFAAINVLIYVGTVAFSYFRHDPTSEVYLRRVERQRARREEQARRRMRRAESRALRHEAKLREGRAEMERKDAERRAAERRKRHDEARLHARRAEDEERARRGSLLARELEPILKREVERARERERDQALLERDEARLRSLQQQLAEVRGARRAAADAVAAEARRILRFYGRLMSLYGASNVRARKDRTTPEVLRELPEIAVPAELDELVARERVA